MPATKTVYVPTGEVRRPEQWEYFQHRTFDICAFAGTYVIPGPHGEKLIQCVAPMGCPEDAEIYEKVIINV